MSRPVRYVIVVTWLLVFLPFVLAGPDDLEEFFTGVATTDIAVDAMAGGDSPLWTPLMALGLPQPLRFHLITHPMAALCAVADCQAVVRATASAHLVAGAIVTALLASGLGVGRGIAAAAGVTFLLTSSAVQPTFVDDWAITAVNEASLPLLVLAALKILDASGGRARARWALALGGLAGLLTSMSFPLLVLLFTAIVLLSRPRDLLHAWPWIGLAAILAIAIGAAQVLHLYEQVAVTPAGALRAAHAEPPVAAVLWSTFLRPLASRLVDDHSWRTIFFGPPFAILAAIAAVASRDRRVRPFQVAFIAACLLMVVPEAWLLNLLTNRWAYRTAVNFFGILLAASALAALTRRAPGARALATAVAALQIAWVAVAVYPVWRPVAAAALSPVPTGERRLARSGALAEFLQAAQQAAPGRVMFGEHAYGAMRALRLAREGVAPNRLPMLGIPTVNVVAHGLTTGALYPLPAMLGGMTPPSAAAFASKRFADVLGLRYLIAMEGDREPPGTVLRGTFAGGVRVYENRDAWPRAFAVERLSPDAAPVLAGCDHNRFLCADFERYQLERTADRIRFGQRAGSVHLQLDPADRERFVVLTEWFVPGWKITSGNAELVRVAGQLIGLRIVAGETDVRLNYSAGLRGVLFAIGLLLEAAVVVALIALRR